MRTAGGGSHGPSPSPSPVTGIATTTGAAPPDHLPPLKDEDYIAFAKCLNSSGTIDRISAHKFRRGLLKHGIVTREEDAVAICLELNSSGGDLFLSVIRHKITTRDPKLGSLLKRFIRTALESQSGSTRNRVLGKIISRAGETMTPEINLLRSSISSYKYIESEDSLLDINDEVIDVVPVQPGIASTAESSPSSASSQRSFHPDTSPSRASGTLPPYSSSRDRILGKIISSAVSTVSLDKPAPEDQPLAQDLTPHAAPHHSSRDKVLAKIISNAISGGSSTSNPSGEPSSAQNHVATIEQGRGSMVPPTLRNSESSLVDLPTHPRRDDDDECALQDYNDDLSVSQRRSIAGIQRVKQPQESKRGGEAKRRVTYDPERHKSISSNPSNEYLHVSIESMNENKYAMDLTLSRESSCLRRHSENSISDDVEVLGQSQSVRAKQLPLNPSNNIRPTANHATSGGRVRNKILNRMVNRVKETMMPSLESNKQRPLSGEQRQHKSGASDIQLDESEWSPRVKEKSRSPSYRGSGKWFHHGKFSATVAIDDSSPCLEQKPAEVHPCRDTRLFIQTMESRGEGDGPRETLEKPQSQRHRHSQKDNQTDREKAGVRSKVSTNSPNPLRHILSDAHLSIPPTEGSFSPGTRGKASPLHLSVSTPQPYRETYRRTLHPHHSPEERPLTPEPEIEEKSLEWKSSEGQRCSVSDNQSLRDRWVGAAPVQGAGSGDHGIRSLNQSHR